jgi:hypothetical protein
MEELMDIASDLNFVFGGNDFNDLQNIADEMLQTQCKGKYTLSIGFVSVYQPTRRHAELWQWKDSPASIACRCLLLVIEIM